MFWIYEDRNGKCDIYDDEDNIINCTASSEDAEEWLNEYYGDDVEYTFENYD